LGFEPRTPKEPTDCVCAYKLGDMKLEGGKIEREISLE
jgi:hypothetical protein